MSTDHFRYWGFISYSHRDRRWGEWIHRQLESYRVPKRLVGSAGAHGPVPARLFPIFRDRDELSTGSQLSEVLNRAIEDSRYYIVVCSPNAAASRWVNEEIRLIKRLGRADRILCLIVDGEPYASDAGAPERECFAPALRHEIGPDGELPERAPEPLAADLRENADGRDGAKLKLLAGLLGVGYDELRRRDLVARNRRLGIAAGIAGVVAIAMAALTVRAVFAERAAEKSRQQGEELIGFMLGDLRGKLEPLGKLDILDAVGDQAMGYFAQLDSRKLSEAQLVSRAKALRQIGDVRFQQGRSAEAANSFDAALRLNRELAARKPQDAELQFELAQAEFWAGNAAWQAGELDRAQPHLEAYRRIALEQLAREPGSERWTVEAAYGDTSLGGLMSSRRQFEPALAAFESCLARLLNVRPDNPDLAYARSSCLSWQGSTLERLGQITRSLTVQAEQVLLARQALARSPDDNRWRMDLGYALGVQAGAALTAGATVAAKAAIAEALPIAQQLMALDPSNVDSHGLDAFLRLELAEALASEFQLDMSASELARAQDTLRRLSKQDEVQIDFQKKLARAAELGYELAMVAGRHDLASRAVAELDSLCAPDSPMAREHSIDCTERYLLSWELAAANATDTNPARTAFESALREVSSDGTRVEQLEARALVLSGSPDQARKRLQPLLDAGYRPPRLVLFARRHPAFVLHHPTAARIRDRP